MSAVGLGSDVLYQAYFVCLTETPERTVIEYGKSQRSTGHGDVFLTMVDTVEPLIVRWYSFGNGEEPLQVLDAHILSRPLTKATCRGENGLDEGTNMCILGRTKTKTSLVEPFYVVPKKIFLNKWSL